MAKKFDLAALMGETAAKLEPEGVQEREIPLDEIEENEANAYAQTDIDELAESIKVVGLQQPLVVWPKPEGGYLLIAGHRRRNALALLGRKTASCRVLDKDFDPALRTLVLHWTNTMVRGGGRSDRALHRVGREGDRGSAEGPAGARRRRAAGQTAQLCRRGAA